MKGTCNQSIPPFQTPFHFFRGQGQQKQTVEKLQSTRSFIAHQPGQCRPWRFENDAWKYLFLAKHLPTLHPLCVLIQIVPSVIDILGAKIKVGNLSLPNSAKHLQHTDMNDISGMANLGRFCTVFHDTTKCISTIDKTKSWYLHLVTIKIIYAFKVASRMVANYWQPLVSSKVIFAPSSNNKRWRNSFYETYLSGMLHKS